MKHAILVAAAVCCVSAVSLLAQPGNDAGTQTQQQTQTDLSNTNAFGVNTNSSSGVSEPAGASNSDSQTQTQNDSTRTVVEPSGAERKVGTIILQGTVETIEQRTAVEQAVRQLPGVTDVKNRITLTGQVKEPSGASTDQGLQGTSPGSTSPSTGSTNNLDQPSVPQTPQP